MVVGSSKLATSKSLAVMIPDPSLPVTVAGGSVGTRRYHLHEDHGQQSPGDREAHHPSRPLRPGSHPTHVRGLHRPPPFHQPETATRATSRLASPHRRKR